MKDKKSDRTLNLSINKDNHREMHTQISQNSNKNINGNPAEIKQNNKNDRKQSVNKQQGNTKGNLKSFDKKGSALQSQQKKTSWYMLPLLFIIAFLPLIVLMKKFDPNMKQFSWFPDESLEVDFFLYYKQWIFVAFAFIMVFLILYKSKKSKEKLKYTANLIPLAIYAVLALLSAIFSDYAWFSFHGSRDQFESIFAILGYCIVVYYAIIFIITEKDIKLIIRYLLISVTILSFLGFTQFIGHDFFGSTFGKSLITFSNKIDLNFIFEKGIVYLTLYNPNYVGVYVALVAPIFLILLLFSKKLVNSLIYLVALLGLAICVIGSHSLTGLVGIAVAAIGILIFMWRYLLRRFYIIVPIFFVLAAALFVINKQTNFVMLHRIQSLFHIEKIERNLTNLETLNDHVSITYKGNIMNISLLTDEATTVSLKVSDGNGSAINKTYDASTDTFLIQDERFPYFSLAPVMYNNYLSFYVKIDDRDWLFTNQTEDGTYYYHTKLGKLDKIIAAPLVGFKGYESFASGRGYIWSHTIPLIKDHIFLGSGPDTFIIAFPQQDYLGYYNNNYEGSIITKPHNLYLQIAVQTGLLSLIAFLVFYLMYFISCLKLYIRGRFNSYYAQVGIAIFIGTMAYMVAGLSNDSSITTAPIFWTLMGVGIVVNQKAKPLILEEINVSKAEKIKKLEAKLENEKNVNINQEVR